VFTFKVHQVSQHTLDHQHRFSWYKTNGNIWLIIQTKTRT